MSDAASAFLLRTPIWRGLLASCRPRVDALVVSVALAAALAAGEHSPARLTILGLACLAASAGASVLGDYPGLGPDAPTGRAHPRRPASRRIVSDDARALGVGLILLSQGAIPVLGVVPALVLLAGAATYVVLYSLWLGPRAPFSVVVAGVALSFAALAGWQTAESGLRPAAQALAAVIVLWVPGHVWALSIVREREDRAAGLPSLCVLVGAERTAVAVLANTLGLVAASLLLAAFLAWPYAAIAVPAGAGFLAAALSLRRHPGTASARRAHGLSVPYLVALLAGLALSTLWP